MICKYILSFSRLPYFLMVPLYISFSLDVLPFAFIALTFFVRCKKSSQRLCQGTYHIYIFFCEFYGFTSSIQVFNPFYFLCIVLDSGPVSFFCMWLPVFPTMFIKEIIVFLHCMFLASLSYVNWPYMLRFISLLCVYHYANTKLSLLSWLCNRVSNLETHSF